MVTVRRVTEGSFGSSRHSCTSEIPGTLLPPTTDLPGTTDKPGKTPTKPGAAPEPGTLLLGGAGVAALLAARRARKRTRTRG